jgi:stage III sporulation protein SpoIIIAA
MNIRDHVDDLKALLDKLPSHIGDYLKNSNDLDYLVEITMDLGRIPEARYTHKNIRLSNLPEVTAADIEIVTNNIGHFNTDNRGGIEA